MLDGQIDHPTKSVVYHKTDWMVIKKETIKASTKLRIDRPEGCTQSTIQIGKMAIEVLWKH
jgi:hypothetical protein